MRVNAWLERWVVRRADAVLFATRGNASDFARHYGETLARKFVHVDNGCDVQEFEDVAPRPPTGRFVLLHAGSLYGARNPVPLLRAAARAIATGRLDADEFRIRLLGHLAPDGDDPLRARQDLGLDQVVEIVDRVSRGESLAEMVGRLGPAARAAANDRVSTRQVVPSTWQPAARFWRWLTRARRQISFGQRAPASSWTRSTNGRLKTLWSASSAGRYEWRKPTLRPSTVACERRKPPTC